MEIHRVIQWNSSTSWKVPKSFLVKSEGKDDKSKNIYCWKVAFMRAGQLLYGRCLERNLDHKEPFRLFTVLWFLGDKVTLCCCTSLEVWKGDPKVLFSKRTQFSWPLFSLPFKTFGRGVSRLIAVLLGAFSPFFHTKIKAPDWISSGGKKKKEVVHSSLIKCHSICPLTAGTGTGLTLEK